MTPPASTASALSVNALSQPLVADLLRDHEALRLKVQTDAAGVTMVDAGIDTPGSLEAGLRIAAICMGGLGQVAWRATPGERWPSWVEVRSSQPVLACLASQYAGWSLSASKEETGARKFFALGSGPARALACKEALFGELAYRDPGAGAGCLVLEVDRHPPPVVIQRVLQACGLQPGQLTVILTPTTSLAGTTQVVARVLEVALHKAHELKFPLAAIVEGCATAPLPPEQAQALIPGGAAVADSRFVLNYYRLSADNRLIFGGGERYTPRPPDDVAGFVRPYLERVFPQLAGVKIDYAWGGLVGVSLNRLPRVGRAGNVFYAHGWSGHGVLLTTLAGALVVEAMQGRAERFALLADLPGKPFPGGPMLRHPLYVLGMAWFALRDRL